ncbi:MAG: transcriptional repressor [Chloroflexi bacterium]|nr:transcriptional repressor [Chloroflexota bacterium]
MNDVRPARHDLLAVLEDNGHRVTSPRRSVISLLEDKSDGFSAEEISSELPGVGRATVYRTIKLLLEAGVICKLVLPDGGSKYSLARVEHHHHTLCIRCGTVGEFRDATIERLVRAIGEDISGEIVGHRMEFDIVCEQCLAASAT